MRLSSTSKPICIQVGKMYVAKGYALKGDVPGHEFHGNQWIAGAIGNLQRGEKLKLENANTGFQSTVTRLTTTQPHYSVKHSRTSASGYLGTSAHEAAAHIIDHHGQAAVMRLRKSVFNPAKLRKAPVGASQRKTLQKLLDKYAAEISSEFKSMIDGLKDDFAAQEIIDLLEKGKVQDALDNLMQSYDTRAKGLRDVFDAAALAGAKAAGEEVAAAGIDFVFRESNKDTIDFLDERAADSVQEITDEMRDLIRETLASGVQDGDNPAQIMRDIIDEVGLTEQQVEYLDNFRSVLEEASSESDYLSYGLRDTRYDATVLDAIQNGDVLDSDFIDKVTGRYVDRLLDYRADTIGRTESTAAVNAGTLESWRQAMEKTPEGTEMRRFWIFTDDDKVREAHTEIPDMNPDGVGMDEPFDTPLGELMYPGDPDGDPENVINCRCVAVYELRPVGEQ